MALGFQGLAGYRDIGTRGLGVDGYLRIQGSRSRFEFVLRVYRGCSL